MAQKIKIVRGTTNDFEVSVVDSEGGAFTITGGERIVFGIKKSLDDENTLFEKLAEVISPGVFGFRVSPEDTETLECGRYYYDVGLQAGTDYFTIIEPNPFDIIPNVTCRGV